MKTSTKRIIVRFIEAISVIAIIIFGIKTHMFDGKINSKLYGFFEFVSIVGLTICIIEFIAKNVLKKDDDDVYLKNRYQIVQNKHKNEIDTTNKKSK